MPCSSVAAAFAYSRFYFYVLIRLFSPGRIPGSDGLPIMWPNIVSSLMRTARVVLPGQSNPHYFFEMMTALEKADDGQFSHSRPHRTIAILAAFFQTDRFRA